jgi:hypothetical protein
MGRFFIFREVSPGEMSPVTWGFEEAKNIRSKVKVFPPLRLPPVSDISANQPIKKRSPFENTCPEQDNNKTICIFAGYNTKGWFFLTI